MKNFLLLRIINDNPMYVTDWQTDRQTGAMQC